MLTELNHTFLGEYEKFLWSQPSIKSESTVWNHMKFIRTYSNEALKQDLIQTYPFRNYTLKQPEPTGKDHLSYDEVKQLYDLLLAETLPNYLQNALHLFLIACFTGLRYGDWKSIKEARKEHDFLIIQRQSKTGKYLEVALHNRLRYLLNWNFEQLHIISGQRARMYLKEIAKRQGIDKKVTTHTARHTFAIIGLNELDWDMAYVSEALDHSSISITQKHYAKYVRKYSMEMMSRWDKV